MYQITTNLKLCTPNASMNPNLDAAINAR
jgi:hypothetical protein